MTTHAITTPGLDTTSANETGKSVFAEYEDIEVMFHVSTMLPHSLGNQQVCLSAGLLVFGL